MSCEVAALPFEEHANYGTWSINFAGFNMIEYQLLKPQVFFNLWVLLSTELYIFF